MHKLRDTSGLSEANLRARLDDIAGRGKVFVLGLGNTDRSDDGAGVLVAEKLKKRFPDCSFSEHDGVEGIVLDLSERDEDLTVLFVDAANIGMMPGAIILVSKEEIKETEITTHRVAVALMASILERNGKKSAVICIQPKTIEFRGRISEPVKSAIDRVVVALSRTIEARQ